LKTMARAWEGTSARLLRQAQGAPADAGLGLIIQRMSPQPGRGQRGNGLIQFIDPENLILEQIAGGDYDGCEGPLWVHNDEGGYLLYGAVHTNIVYKWTPAKGAVEYKNPSNEASAFVPDPHNPGAFLVPEQTTRRIVRYNTNGTVTTVADQYQGKSFNRPNDLVLHSDGSLWFSDPDWLFKQRPEEIKELDAQHIFRIDLKTGAVNSMDASLNKPNGIAFSHGERYLYATDSPTPRIYRWPVLPNKTLGPRETFASLAENGLDGIKFDKLGNLWVAAKQHVFIISPQGVPFAKIAVPIKPTAIAFGGPRNQTPYITTRKAVFRLTTPLEGEPG
ncbi:MAG: SMP-30/gluconolactonase/LRE family protein, partial [Verrucomicrobiota bacterium]